MRRAAARGPGDVKHRAARPAPGRSAQREAGTRRGTDPFGREIDDGDHQPADEVRRNVAVGDLSARALDPQGAEVHRELDGRPSGLGKIASLHDPADAHVNTLEVGPGDRHAGSRAATAGWKRPAAWPGRPPDSNTRRSGAPYSQDPPSSWSSTDPAPRRARSPAPRSAPQTRTPRPRRACS